MLDSYTKECKKKGQADNMEKPTITLEQLASELDTNSRRIQEMVSEIEIAQANKDNISSVKIEISYKDAGNITYYANNKESMNDYVIKRLDNHIKHLQNKSLEMIKDFKADNKDQLENIESLEAPITD